MINLFACETFNTKTLLANVNSGIFPPKGVQTFGQLYSRVLSRHAVIVVCYN